MRKVIRIILESLKKVFLVGEPPDSPHEAAVNPDNWELLRETLLMFFLLALVVGVVVIAWLTGQV